MAYIRETFDWSAYAAWSSGCVRGTVVDAFSLNFKVAVPQDCVYDRSITSHKVNLFDMGQKYADVMPVAELLGLLDA